MFHGDCPDYLSVLVPNQRLDLHDHRTRGSSNLQTVLCRTSYYQKSFLPAVVNLWNNIPDDIRLNQSKSGFKTYLSQNINKIPLYFHFGCRREQICLARIRLQSSVLRDHLFKKNLIENSLCSCGRVETTSHYFFKCPKYNEIRRDTIGTISCSNLKIILYGDSRKADEDNMQMFHKVSEYINKTKRFES